MRPEFFFLYLIFSAALALGVQSAFNSEYEKQKIIFLESKMRLVRRADNLAAISEPIV
jgi:hypothetical protein